MCGIVGYIGPKQAQEILLEGLRKLEYRGYDSAGLAVYNGETLGMCKAEGRLSELEHRLSRPVIARAAGNRPHPVGDPWKAVGCKCSPAHGHGPTLRRRPQRDHRELPGVEGGTPGQGLHLQIGDGFRSGRPPFGRPVGWRSGIHGPEGGPADEGGLCSCHCQ